MEVVGDNQQSVPRTGLHRPFRVRWEPRTLGGSTDMSRGTSRCHLAAGDARGAAAKLCLGKGPPGDGCAGVAPCLCSAADNLTGAQLEMLPFFSLVAEDEVRFLKNTKDFRNTFSFVFFSKELPARQKSQIISPSCKNPGECCEPSARVWWCVNLRAMLLLLRNHNLLRSTG